MSHIERPIAFILAASNHGTLIVNRNDFNAVQNTVSNYTYGVGHQILSKSSFDPQEVQFVLSLLALRRRYFGDGVFAIDGGANIGVHSVEWARHMNGWGRVLSFEAQEIIYYALAGNLALNNCLNARARLAALGESVGEIGIPQPDYFSSASFGSLEIRPREHTEFIGQAISYDAAASTTVPMISIDSLKLERVDLLKIDVEGMEMDVLRGARETLLRCKPALLVEWIKGSENDIRDYLRGVGYETFYSVEPNVLAIAKGDPLHAHLNERDGVLNIG
ncbi:FkbM family methyltransferase [Caballeronia sp. GAWG2-1]|uniref:FkbM family methyltransferase n=1 Tax=Caballeronia sp. GAWG2-1 TaxID=2921744 RepID=UPI002027C3E0|nr:FkbM family methyltransferase [Caballeronia sp. GAWG2-1]